MAKMHVFGRDEVFPSWFPNAIQEALSTMAGNFRLRQTAGSDTTVEVPAGPAADQVTLGFGGALRYITATVQRAHPGGAAGTYGVFATAKAQDIRNVPQPYSDFTDYSFTLSIQAPATTPAIVAGVVDMYRQVGEIDWDGSKITAVRQLVGQVHADDSIRPTAPRPTEVPLRVIGAVGQSADFMRVETSAGVAALRVDASQVAHVAGDVRANAGTPAESALSSVAGAAALTLGSAADTSLYRGGVGVLRTDGGLSLGVNATPAAGSLIALNDLFARQGAAAQAMLGSVAGAGGVMLGGDTSLSRSSSGVLRASGYMDVASGYRVAGVALAASHLSNGVTGSGLVALATSPALAGTPTAPTAAVTATGAQLATLDYVLSQASASTPLMDGGAAIGALTRYARADHIHPTDSTRAPLASPAFTGAPTAPTMTFGTAGSTGAVLTIASTAGGQLSFGGDTTLWRASSGRLQTGGEFIAGTLTSSGAVNVGVGTYFSNSAAGTITAQFSGDTTLGAKSDAAGNPSVILKAVNGAPPYGLIQAGDNTANRELKLNPFGGLVSAPTPTTGDNSQNVATTAWVRGQGYLTSLGGNVAYLNTNNTFTLDQTLQRVSTAVPLDLKATDAGADSPYLAFTDGSAVSLYIRKSGPQIQFSDQTTVHAFVGTGGYVTARVGFAINGVDIFGNATPLMDGGAAAGGATTAARVDHRHPTDTSRAALTGAGFSGAISAPSIDTGGQLSANSIISDQYITAYSTSINQVALGRTAAGIANPGITFGNSQDTNIYRGGANTLKTDDALAVEGRLYADGGLSVTSGGANITGQLYVGSGGLYVNSGGGSIYGGMDIHGDLSFFGASRQAQKSVAGTTATAVAGNLARALDGYGLINYTGSI